jgi:hypothetical protein
MANPVGKVGFKIVSRVIGIPVGIAAGRMAERLWQSARPGEHPRKPTEPDVTWTDALGWAAVSAAGVAAAQLVSYRSAASVWRALTGSNPPAPKDKTKNKKADAAAVTA